MMKINTWPYVQNVNTAKTFREAVLLKLRLSENITDIYDKFHSITILDGVLDFKTKRFYKWENVDFEYYTIIMIDYEYNEYFMNQNTVLINELKN